MSTQITYDQLRKIKLGNILKNEGKISLLLIKKRAMLCVKFFELINIVMGDDDENISTGSYIFTCFKLIVLMFRITIFHRKLFRVFTFFIIDSPMYSIEKNNGIDHKINLVFTSPNA